MSDIQIKNSQKKPFKLSGWHFLGIMLSFFGVIIIVNIVFVTRALDAFSGLVVKNSYVASQEYNEKIEQADAQKSLNWKLDLLVNAKGADFILNDKTGKPVSKMLVTVNLRMNKNTDNDMVLILNEQNPGHYIASLPKGATPPNGSWIITMDILQKGKLLYHYEEFRGLNFD